MDRRHQKTQAAIFDAFVELLAESDYAHITVQQIIDRANVGRTTFYDHFETKDSLMRQLCHSLFSHVFEAAQSGQHAHGGEENAGNNALLHVLHHIREDDRMIRTLLLRDSTGTAERYFREGVEDIIREMILGTECAKVPCDHERDRTCNISKTSRGREDRSSCNVSDIRNNRDDERANHAIYDARRASYCINYLVSAFLNTTQWWLHEANDLAPAEVIALYSSASQSAFRMMNVSG